MKEDGLLPYWDIASKTVNVEVFNNFINTRHEDEAWERYVRTRIPLNTGSYSILARGMYALQCRQWFRSFEREKFLVMKLEELLDTSSPSPNPLSSMDVNNGNSDGPNNKNDDDISSGGVGGGEKGVQSAVNKVMAHLGLPQFEVRDTEKKNAREYIDPLEGDAAVRTCLQRFFAPHNVRFGKMMVEEMGYDETEWMDLWKY